MLITICLFLDDGKMPFDHTRRRTIFGNILFRIGLHLVSKSRINIIGFTILITTRTGTRNIGLLRFLLDVRMILLTVITGSRMIGVSRLLFLDGGDLVYQTRSRLIHIFLLLDDKDS